MRQKLVIIVAVLTIVFSTTRDTRAQWVQTAFALGAYGSVNCFAVSGMNLFAGTEDSGVFLSTDRGASWTNVSTGLTPGSYPYTFAVSGSNLFLGTDGRGVYFSTNNGASWTWGTGLTSRFALSLAVIGSSIFVGTGTGVFLSINNGVSWTSASTGLPAGSNGYPLLLNGTNLFTGTLDSGVYLSKDSGKSWNSASGGQPNLSVNFVNALAASGATLLAGTSSGIFLSTTNGASWTVPSSGISSSYVNVLAVSGANLFAGVLGGVFLSTNNGTSWTNVSTGLLGGAFDVSAFTIIDSNLYAGTGNGIWRRSIPEMIAQSAVDLMPPTQNSISAYPNPFSQSTTIGFSSPKSGVAEVSIVNLLGTQVTRLFEGELAAGEHTFTWNAAGLPPGAYWGIVRMSGHEVQVPIVLE